MNVNERSEQPALISATSFGPVTALREAQRNEPLDRGDPLALGQGRQGEAAELRPAVDGDGARAGLPFVSTLVAVGEVEPVGQELVGGRCAGATV